MCTAPATQKAAAAPAAPTRAAAPPGGSVYCACHAKGSRGPSGAHARRSSSRRLCVLRLPRQRQPRPQRRPRAPRLLQEALCTAPATPKAARKLSVQWVNEWVSECECECECECVSEWVSEGRGGGGRRRAAGSKRKTRTPHSDVGKNSWYCGDPGFSP